MPIQFKKEKLLLKVKCYWYDDKHYLELDLPNDIIDNNPEDIEELRAAFRKLQEDYKTEYKQQLKEKTAIVSEISKAKNTLMALFKVSS